MAMKRKEVPFIIICSIPLSLGISLFLWLLLRCSSFSIIEHSLRLAPAPFFFLFFLCLGLFLCLWLFLRKIETRTRQGNSPSLLNSALSWFPLLFFYSSPFLLRHYLTQQDLQVRLLLLGIFVFFSIIYLKAIIFSQFINSLSGFLKILEVRISALSWRKKALLLFLIAWLIYNLCTLILVFKGVTFSGDEPYYLLTSHSLLYDGDINLANNFANKDYFAFYSKEENPRLKLGIYGRYGRKGKDTIYPINLPGISVLMLPFYWLSQFFQGKALTFILKSSLSIWAAFLGVQLYLFAKEFWQKEGLSLLLWFIYSFSSPILFYAFHLYPEIPIACFSLYIFRKITSSRGLSNFSLIFPGFLLSTFPWFGLKYNLILWPILAISVYLLLKENHAGKRILFFLIFPLVSNFLFYYFIYHLYGTFSPLSVYEGVMTPEQVQAYKEMVLKIPVMARVESFLDYFLDQRDGLLLYAPVYFFAFLGLVEMFRHHRSHFLFVIFISFPFLFNYAFLTHRQGYCPQGRVLAPLSWMGAIALGYFIFFNRKRLFSFFFSVACGMTLVFAFLLLKNPSFLYQPTTHDFTSRPGELFLFLSNLHFLLPPFLPSFIKIPNLSYLPNYFWVLGTILFILAYALLKGKMEIKGRFHFIFCSLFLVSSFFLWIYYPRTVPYITHTVYYTPQKALGFYLFPMGKGVVAKPSGELYLHFEKPYKILFMSKIPLEKIQVQLGSEKGEYQAKLAFFDLPLLETKSAYEKKEFTFSLAAHYPLRNLYLYELNLKIKKLSPESMLIDPFYFFIIPEGR